MSYIYMLKGNRYTTVRAKRERGKMSKTIEAYPPSPRRAHTHTKLEEALEIQSLRRIISAYLNYSDAAEEDVKRCERSFRKLPHAHKALLSNFPSKCRNLRRCISENSFFILNILEAFEPPLDMSQDVDICECDHIEHSSKDSLSGERRFCTEHLSPAIGCTRDSEADQISCEGQNEFTCPSLIGGTTTEEVTMVPETVPGSLVGSSEYIKESESPDRNDVKIVQTHTTASSISDSNGNVSPPRLNCLDPTFQLHVPLVDVDKVRCIIRNIVRDWAPEGLTERDQCYKPILEELDHLFPSRDEGRRPCCLVPGAGLGRLALEISTLGFISQGNEFSYYMMICSSFILNHTQSVGEWTIYPWIHSNCNSLSDNDQLRAVSFPDIHPASAGITEGFSMCGGDFVEVYNDPTQLGAWDAVVTCFFLDTAHNVVEYIEIISKILKDGGVWINLGPLLYHFADAYGTEDEMSIELSLEDLKSVAFHYGFHMQQEKTIETTYTANPRSMMQTRYNAAFWTMIKKGDH